MVHEPADGGLSAGAEPAQYDDDLLLLIGDWYHLTADEVQKTYDTYQFWGMEPVPDSLLVNGHGSFNCSKAVKSKPIHCMAVPSPQLVSRAGKSRVRIINVGLVSLCS